MGGGGEVWKGIGGREGDGRNGRGGWMGFDGRGWMGSGVEREGRGEGGYVSAGRAGMVKIWRVRRGGQRNRSVGLRAEEELSFMEEREVVGGR